MRWAETQTAQPPLLNKRRRHYRRLQIHLGGAEARDRTEDTGIFSAVLYQLSYLSNSQ